MTFQWNLVELICSCTKFDMLVATFLRPIHFTIFIQTQIIPILDESKPKCHEQNYCAAKISLRIIHFHPRFSQSSPQQKTKQ